MKLLQFYISVFLTDRLWSYEVFRLPDERRTTYYYDDMHLQFPRVNGYGGPVGRSVMIPCKVQTRRPGFRPQIHWYRHVPENATCHRNQRALMTSEGQFCPERRSRFLTRSRIKYASRLVIRRPQLGDSGLYLCRVSAGGINMTLITRLAFHEEAMYPVRVLDALNGQYGEGRVEVLINNKWMEFSAHTWQTPEASLLCRLLGYRHGGEPRYPRYDYPQAFRYTGNNGNVISLKCPLNSTRLTDCRGLDRRRTKMPPAGVTCRRSSSPVPTKKLRLFGNPPLEGRVEVYSQGFWGTLCMKGITENEVSMICRAMGYNFGGVLYKAWHPSYQYYNTGVGPIMLSGLQCPRNASHLDQCSHGEFGLPCCNCTHDDDLAVRCRISPEEEDGVNEIRLVGYDSTNKGRVELYHNGSWGTVNAYYVHEQEANMFCKMAGFPHGGEPFAAFRGYELMWIGNDLSCPMVASRLDDCSFIWRRLNRPYTAAGVICREHQMEVPAVPFRIKINEQGTERLQYYSDGYWGTVCGIHVGGTEASMICSMMGHRFGGTFSKSYDTRSSHGFGPILMKYLDCPLNSTILDQCGFRDYKRSRLRSECTIHEHDTKLRCFDVPTNLSLPIRLIRNEANRGILEVYHNGSWGLVDGSNPSNNPAAAAVACRQLGFNNGGETFVTYANEVKPTRSLDCSGNEANVGQCTNLFWDSQLWIYDKALGIECYEPNDNHFTVSLREITNNESAIVLRKGRETYLLCANMYDKVHARAYCVSAGYSDGIPRYLDRYDFDPYQQDKMVKAMYCQRGVANLRRCFHTGWNNDDCDLGLVAGVTCIP